MTLTSINHALHMSKDVIRKNMTISMLLLVVVICTTGYIIGNVKAHSDRPLIDLNKIELNSHRSAKKITGDYPGVNVKISNTIRLPKSLDGQYLSSLKQGLNSDLHVKSFSVEGRRGVLLKIDENNIDNVVTFPSLANKEGISSYDIDERGYIYVAHYGGGITVVSNDGKMVSTIQTGDFRPTKLVVDKEYRIWAIGELLDATIMKYIMKRTMQDYQIRVYSVQGRLLNIAAGGITPPDIGLGTLTSGEGGVYFVSHYDRTALYKFDKNMQFVQVKRFPFEQIANYKQSGVADMPVDRSACGITDIQIEHGPLVKGITEVKKLKLWYGNMRSDTRGVYGSGFIGVTDMQDNPLTPCIVLPVQFQGILGDDSHGNIYVIDRNNGYLVLHKVVVRIDHAPDTRALSD